jgi:hypothetical protein
MLRETIFLASRVKSDADRLKLALPFREVLFSHKTHQQQYLGRKHKNKTTTNLGSARSRVHQIQSKVHSLLPNERVHFPFIRLSRFFDLALVSRERYPNGWHTLAHSKIHHMLAATAL